MSLQKLSLLLALLASPLTAAPFCAGYTPPPTPEAAAKTALAGLLSPTGTVHALVLSAGFPHEIGRNARAAFTTAQLFAPDRPGSLGHFFSTMSFGQFRLEGTAPSRRYAGSEAAPAYIDDNPARPGDYGRFVVEVLQEADKDLDFGRFDNDGPDGRPNSGDDDGIVDYLFVNMRSVPRGFLIGGATGKAGLGFFEYETGDRDPQGRPIVVRGDSQFGSISGEGNLAQTIGVMAHEFGHAFGLPDLYDTQYVGPQSDSGGIGRWGLMGHGAYGWSGAGGPTGFSAWTLERLGWIGPANSRLDTVWSARRDLPLPDLFAGGRILKILLPQPPAATLQRRQANRAHVQNQGYLLLETRDRGAHYYNRDLPGEGLLVWHVRSEAGANSEEMDKLVDLVCADGLTNGRDDLDLWAHEAAYRQAHGGNLGDATDPFDGTRFTRLGPDSNPPIHSVGDFSLAAVSPLDLRITRRGGVLRADIDPPRWAGPIAEAVDWSGAIVVDGDLTVLPEGQLRIHPATRVLFAAGDRLAAGNDPNAAEMTVHGNLTLTLATQRLPVRLQAFDPDQTWYGLIINTSPQTAVEIPPNALQLAQARHGIQIDGRQAKDFGVVFDEVRVHDTAAPDRAGNGDGRLQAGEAFGLSVQLTNASLQTYKNTRLQLSWDDREALSPQWAAGLGSVISEEQFDLSPGRTLEVRFPVLSLAADYEGPLDLTMTLRASNNSSIVARPLSLPVRPSTPLPSVQLAVEGTVPQSQSTLTVARQVPIQLTIPAGRVDSVDLLARPLNSADFLAPIPMRRVPGTEDRFRAEFTAPDQTLYELVPRVHRGGQIGLDDTRLWLDVIFERWHPHLVVWDRGYSAATRQTLQSLIEANGINANYLTSSAYTIRQRQGVESLLDHYLDPRSSVVWLATDMTRNAQLAMGAFLQAGGRLLVASKGLHTRLYSGPLKEYLQAATVRTQTDSAPLRGVGQLASLDFASSYSVFSDLQSPAQPFVLDEADQAAGMRLEDGATRLAYLAFDLHRQDDETTRALLQGAFGFLLGTSDRSKPYITAVHGVAAFAGLDLMQPRLVLHNDNPVPTDRLRLGYRVLDGERQIAARSVPTPALTPGQIREFALPLWRPPYEADYTVEFGVLGPDEEYTWRQPVRVVNAQGNFSAAPLEEGGFANGAGLFDYDGDGDLDLYLVRLDRPNQLWRNQDGRLTPVAAGPADDGTGRGLAVGDYDGDGDLDLYLVNEGADRFYQNDDGLFVAAQVPGLGDDGSGRSASFLDHDGDGDLDLYLVNSLSANRLFQNDAGAFRDVAPQVGLDDDGQGRGLAIADYDNDGDPDLLVTNQSGQPSRLYRNDNGAYRDVAAEAGLVFNRGEVAGLFGDFDGDGHQDIFLSSENAPNSLWRQTAQGTFAAVEADMGQRSVGAASFDYDNDGDLDLVTTSINQTAGGDRLFHNRGTAGFASLGDRIGLRPASRGRAISVGDLDDDGRQDLVVADYDSTHLYRNGLRPARWLKLGLRDSGLNPDALGARVELFTPQGRQVRELQSSYGYGSQVQPLLHFGVGDALRVDSLRVTWPDGQQSQRLAVASNQLLLVDRPLTALPAKIADAAPTLAENFPNPFNARTTIAYRLAAPGPVRLTLYDALGQRVRTLVKDARPAGAHRAVWDGRDDQGRAVASGFYLYRLQAGERTLTRKLLLLK